MSTIIRITSAAEGFRRAGIAHAAQATDHPAERFSAEQLAQLRAEPLLRVEQIDAEDAPEAPAKAAAKPAGKGKK